MGMYLIAMIGWSSIWWWISVVLKVGVGLGAVIFVHELGHYLVARLCGVKIEKFMIGFDIGGYKLSWRRGETLYGIGILPLGGYVKMLGQDDDPAHVAEQMRKSQVEVNSANAQAIKGPDGETYYVDRRSYLAKSVPQRMAIISAGVVMNIIFAFIFAAIAYGMGVPYIPAVVSETAPGSPAWHAGIQTGDEIVQLGDRPDPTFIQLKGGVTLGDLERGIQLKVRRAADGKIVDYTLHPQLHTGGLATIGLAPPLSLTLFDDTPTIDDSPAANAKVIKPAASNLPAGEAKLLDGDEIIRVGDVPVKDYREFSAQLARQPEKALLITVRRTSKADEASSATQRQSGESAATANNSQELTFEVPPQPLHQFDLGMKMGPIVSVRENSPAAAAGIVQGDVIEKVDGKTLGERSTSVETWNATTLPDYLRRAADAGRNVELTLSRPTGDDSHRVEVQVKPQIPVTMNMVVPTRPPGAPMAADTIGIAYPIENEVAQVTPNTPAATDFAPGDKILDATLNFPKDKDGKVSPPITIKLGDTNNDWPRLLDTVQFVPAGTEVEFTLQRGDAETRKVKLAPVPAEGAFVAARGFWFKTVERIRKANNVVEQVRYGWEETRDGLTMVFAFLKKLGTQVPISALGGPVTIAKAAGYSAAEGISSLLIFLTMLSANLAVLNFLPIPLLDGGHMVFLAYEGIRGRPANEKFVVALHTAGFVFIVSLMLYVFALDLHIIPRNL